MGLEETSKVKIVDAKRVRRKRVVKERRAVVAKASDEDEQKKNPL